MSRRLLAAVAAVLLAVAGAWVLFTYVSGADARARAGEELTTVLVVSAEVPSGTAADDLGSAVTTVQVPARLVTAGVLEDLSAVQGLVTTAELLPGEMVLAGRFAEPSALRTDGSMVAPDGLVEVSATLEVQRAAGGTLTPGDRVGVTLTNRSSGDGGITSYSTFSVLHDVLVTRVTAPADAGGTWDVTLAVSPEDASATIVGLEAQAVWLSLESDQAGTSSTTSTTTSAAITGDDQ